MIRIILKDLKIGLSHTVILKHYHKEAVDLFNSTSDLLEVFTQIDLIENNSSAINSRMTRLFFAIKPMLACKMTPNMIQMMFQKDKGLQCMVETKYDGERVQCHI